MASKKLTRLDSPNAQKPNLKRKSGRVTVAKGNSFSSPDGVEQFEPVVDLTVASQQASNLQQSKTASELCKQVHVASVPTWVKFSDRKLLDMQISDLGLDFEQTRMVDFREQLHCELKQLGLAFKPHCWFSDDWFSPDNVPGIAVPFYMAHRRLMRLERNQMLEVEGGTKQWCMRIMRHEAGHAIDTAFGLHRKRGYKATFGSCLLYTSDAADE